MRPASAPRAAALARARVALCALALGLAPTAAAGAAREPATLPDEGWLSVTGTIAATGDDAFTLDYGQGVVTVETDHWDWRPGAPPEPGERVTVYGEVGDDLFDTGELTAEDVLVRDRGAFYERGEAAPYVTPSILPPVASEGSWLSIAGEVTEIDDPWFTLDTGHGPLRVDTRGLGYDPFDDVGIQRLDVGDRVAVSGALDRAFFERREMRAESVATLARERSGAPPAGGTSSSSRWLDATRLSDARAPHGIVAERATHHEVRLQPRRRTS
jgi:hypothetical protein